MPSEDEMRERRMRERYEFVRNHDPELYGKIVAFAGTIDLLAKNARFKIEDYCMGLAKRILEAQLDA